MLHCFFPQNILDSFNEGRHKSVENLQLAIEDEKKVEEMLTCRKDIVEIMKVRGQIDNFTFTWL